MIQFEEFFQTQKIFNGGGDGMLYTLGQLSVFELESAIRAILKE